jgi:signal transduction histidine kinase
MRFSIRYQLLLPLFVLLLGMVGISTWTGVGSARRARQQIEQDMRSIAQHLSEAPYKLQANILPYLKRLSGADFVLVDPADPGNRPTTLPLFPADLPPAEYVVDEWEALRFSPPIRVAGESYLGSGLRVRSGSSVSVVYILYPEQLWRDALWSAIQPSLVLGAFGGVASVILAILLSGRLARRIQGLERRTRLIARGDFSPMPLPSRNDELRDLSQSVNQMAEQLLKLQETVKQTERLRLLGQVGGGLAHQLRNSVTGARLAVQLHVRDCNGQGDTEALDVALRQLSLVEVNLKRFLDLGRTGGLHTESCDLRVQIDEAVGLLRPQCRHAGTDLRWEPPEGDFSLTGDPGQLGHLFMNVIANAVEAAGTGGCVEISLSALPGDNHLALVEVIDSGPGPPPEICERLFQPFVTGKREGVGLGLAVARQVAEAHAGRIEWRRNGAKTCFRIELPLTG